MSNVNNEKKKKNLNNYIFCLVFYTIFHVSVKKV